MSHLPAETIPTAWVDDRDVGFFRITSILFPPSYLAAAGVLLASNDHQRGAVECTSEADASALVVIYDQMLRSH